MRKYIVWLGVLFMLGACATLPEGQKSERQHGAGDIQGMDHKSSFFVARKGVADGYVFIFHVMPSPEGESYSRTFYHLMVSVEKNGQPMVHLKLYSAVEHPDGSMEKKALMMQMGNWYMARYNLSHEQGRHWITVSFDLDGNHYPSGIYYPEWIVR